MMPPEPKKHHFVPQVYLKNFSFIYKNAEERLFAFDRGRVVNKIPIHFSSYTPAEICYRIYLYKIKNMDMMGHFGIEDNNVVEKEAFKVYENSLIRILERLKTVAYPAEKRFISMGDALLLVKTLLNMKKRNPYFMNHEDKKSTVKRTNEKYKNDILKEKPVWEERFRNEGYTLEEAFKLLDKLTESPEFIEDLIRFSLLLEGSGETNNTLSQIARLLLNKVWFIYESTIDNQFITSDNPGYCVNNDFEAFNTNFTEDFVFIFPISPTQLLYIINQEQDTLLPPSKELVYKEASPEFVESINFGTMQICNKFIYSNSEITLIKVIDHWKATIGDNPAFPESNSSN